jgi:hypothetical protein
MGETLSGFLEAIEEVRDDDVDRGTVESYVTAERCEEPPVRNSRSQNPLA